MISIFICLFVAIISFNFFMISYQINGINRLVYSAPLSLFETAINLYDISDESELSFDKELLIDNLTSYFDYHLPRYTNDYEIDFYYYKPSDHSLDMSDNPKAVEVNVTANIVLNNHYQKSMFYEIRSN